MEKKLRVAGSVIGELSDKIPSNIIALNELIKNSYDAGAKEVSIVLDTSAQKLTISDDGDGMDDSEIGILLQVSKSAKKYGSINPQTGRHIQGSKGLGFLSVFKFGDIVKWTTIKDKQRCFTINYKDVLKLDDVSDYVVPISEEKTENLETGTRIEITLKNDFNSNQLNDYLSNQMNRDKILNAFIDNRFIIRLEVGGQIFRTKECLSLMPYYTENQLFQVSFSSKSKEMSFSYKNHYKYGETTNTEKVIHYRSNIDSRFKISLELMIFDFSGTKRKNDPDQLFIVHPNKLTPLIYINKNLFNNFSIFDPDLLRYSQSGISLPQMIGYIEIISDDKDIQFNSDRTQFQENELTESIRLTLEDINRLIQKSGSDFKLEIKKSNARKETAKRTVTPPPIQGSGEVPPKGGNTIQPTSISKRGLVNSPPLQTPKLNVKDFTREVPTQPLSRKDYIVSAINSLGQNVDYDTINVEMDGNLVANGIIESIEVACRKTILCSYNDPQTGRVATKFFLIATNNPSPLETQKSNPVLIPNRARKEYAINFKENPITNLVPQLNKLYSQTKIEYHEVIACSLRALFELAIYELEISRKIEYKFTKKPSLQDKVKCLVNSVYANAKLLGEIKNGLGKPSYDDFKNELNIIDFPNTIKKCHLGAHKATNSLTSSDLESVGKEVALFLVIVSELLNNQNINWVALGQPWKIEIN